MRLDSEFEEVFADPNDLRTVNAAAKCLKASVSCPPPFKNSIFNDRNIFH